MPKNNNELINTIIHAMEALKGIDVTIIDVSKLTSITDHMLLASGQSTRQVKAIANRILEDTKQKGYTTLGVEGMDQGQWVLLDFGDAIAHIMHPDSRNYYQLEKLWSFDAQDRAEQT